MKNIQPAAVWAQVQASEPIHIIDVRQPEEVATGIIPGAINIPLGLLEFRMHELDKKKEYVIVCQAGGRSMRASQFLASQGFQVINMNGGMNEWTGDFE